jgi:hypothetical protein
MGHISVTPSCQSASLRITHLAIVAVISILAATTVLTKRVAKAMIEGARQQLPPAAQAKLSTFMKG